MCFIQNMTVVSEICWDSDEALYHAKNTQKGTFVEHKKTAFDDIPKL